MEIITKKIILESAKSRVSGVTPITDKENIKQISDNWGMFPCDTTLSSKTQYGSGIPFIENGNRYRLRYRTMMDVYYKLKKQINECKYYKLCKRNNSYYFLEQTPDDNTFWKITMPFFLKNLDEKYKNGRFLGKLFCLFPDYDNFIKVHNTITKAKNFCNLVENLLYYNQKNVLFEHQYFNIPLYLEQTIYDGGNLGIYESEWNEGDLYHVGSRVIKDNKVWELSSPSDINEKFKISENNTPKENVKVLVERSTSCGEETSYYRDEFNEITKKVEFNSYTDSITPRWLEDVNNTTEINNIISVASESKLSTMQRRKISYSDDSKELPFIVTDDWSIEIPYLIGQNINVEIKDDVKYCDKILSITLINGNNRKILTNSEIQEWFYDYNFIEFKYIKGAIIKNGTISGGITYIENRTLSPAVLSGIRINNVKKDYIYPYIGEVVSCNVEYNHNTIVDNNLNVTFFKDDMILGLHDISFDIGDITIDRGNSSAFERRSILGEVVTFQDLENYKNDLFKLNKT